MAAARIRHHRHVTAALCVGFGLTIAAAAQATVVQNVSVPALAAEADRVVLGVVTDQRVRPGRQGRGLIVTESDVEVLVDLTPGAAPAEPAERETVVLEQLGGTLDGRTLHVSGTAHLEPGTEVVLFLISGAPAKHGAARPYYLAGLALGAFAVERRLDGPSRVSRDLADLTLYGAPTSDPPVTLGDLVRALHPAAPVAGPDAFGAAEWLR